MPLLKYLIISLFLLQASTTMAQVKPLNYLDVDDFRVHKVDLQQITVIVGLRFYNPNIIGVKLKDGDIDAYFNNKYLGKGIVDETVKVPARDTFIIPVAITTSLENVLTNALDIFSGNKKVLVKLAGTVKAGKAGIYFTIPVKYEGEEELNF